MLVRGEWFTVVLSSGIVDDRGKRGLIFILFFSKFPFYNLDNILVITVSIWLALRWVNV